MKKHCKYLLCLMFALLLGILMAQGKETTEVNYASGSSSDYIMGVFEAVSKNGDGDYCNRMTITVYEIEGTQGSYYALIDGQKYKVTDHGKNYRGEREGWFLYDCDRKDRNWFYYAITYNAKTWYFNMPVY